MGEDIKFIDRSELMSLVAQSKGAKIRRAKKEILNHSGRISYSFIVMQPDSYVRPHCHPKSLFGGTSGSQMIVVLKGKIALIVIDSRTGLMKKRVISATGDRSAASVDGHVFHCAVALAPNTLILEIAESGRCVKSLATSPLSDTKQASELVKLWKRMPAGSSFHSPLIRVK